LGEKSRGTKLLWEMVFVATTHENETGLDKKINSGTPYSRFDTI